MSLVERNRFAYLTLWGAALLTVVLTGILCPAPAGAIVPIHTILHNEVSLSAGNLALAVTAFSDTPTGNWVDLNTDTNPALTGHAGAIIRVPVTLHNAAGLEDTFTLTINSPTFSLTWSLASGGVPVSNPQAVPADDTLVLELAISVPADSVGAADSLTVIATSDAGGASDTVVLSLQVVQVLAGFALVVDPVLADFGSTVPLQVYAGLAFGATVVALDGNGAILTTFDSDVTVTGDTGTVAPVLLPAGSWVAGVWNGNLVLTDCFDTVQVTFRNGLVAKTVAVQVVNYLVMLDRAAYQGLQLPVLITVYDPAADTPAGTGINTVRVQVSSTADAAGITVTLTESGLATGTFVGSVAFTQGGSVDGKIRVDSNGNIFVTYDPDGAGAAAAVTAQASWVALTVGNLDGVRTWPNPFRWSECREILITPLPPDPGIVVELYNLASQRVRTLRVGNDITVSAQDAVARWDGCNDHGDLVASGTYIYLVRSSYGFQTGKLTFIK